MRLPPHVVPLLERVVASPALPRGLPPEVWREPDHRRWVDAFLELGIALHDSDLDEASLPTGYVLVAWLFSWEAECQSEGWNAFAWRERDFERIAQCYRDVGLADEAVALEHAYAEWQRSGGDPHATSAAYDQHRHALSGDLDRLEHLACHFIDHADALFYVPDDA
jgi:hypothetical protein